jgi:RNA polymerase sigma-70 factor (ECF subfamily)
VRRARSKSELALVLRLQAGDGDAVSELAAAYGGRIFQLAFRCLRNREDAEELTQDVLLIVCRRIRTFRCDSALSSWIHRITFNAAMSRLRRARLRRRFERTGFDRAPLRDEGGFPRAIPDPIDTTPAADELMLRAELRARLDAALVHVPEPFRNCLELRDVQGLSTREASAVLCIKPQTLKSRVHRGRRILQRRLKTGLWALAPGNV